MFHRIDFTKLGGFPLTQNTMAFLQESYNNVLEAVSRMGGQYIILSGLTQVTPNQYSPGWVCIDGEIVPFEGGLGQTNVSVVESGQSYTFRDSSIQTVLYGRKLVFNAGGTIPFSSFKRLSLDSLNTFINNVNTTAQNAQTTANQALSGSFSAGMIIMWSGAIGSIPSGWKLCNGLDGTPNLKGKFVVGYSASTGTYSMGATGGAASIPLTPNQLASHSHNAANNGDHSHTYADSYYIENVGSTGGAKVPGTLLETLPGNYTGSQSTDTDNNRILYRNRSTQNAGTHSHTISSTGAGEAHENRPPYYTLAYIIKV